MKVPTCLDTDGVVSLLESEANKAVIEYGEHLETCLRCQATLAELSDSGSTMDEIARYLSGREHAPPSSGAALDRVMTQLKSELVLLARTPEDAGDEREFALSVLSPADRPELLGLLGGYEVHEEIGRGGMGVVFKAFDPLLQRLVAIKIMAAAVADSVRARRRFIREAQAAAAVCHDHIVPVHGVYEKNGVPYLVMQYVEGESLQTRLDRDGPLDVLEVVRVGLDTVRGLAAAHAHALIHRDIKPANLLLEKAPAHSCTGAALCRVKITDFGLARMAGNVQLTQKDVVAGTPNYMSPEQARGETVDHRTDLFSLGCVLYAACTGVTPFQGSNAVTVLRQVTDQTPTPIREFNADVPKWLEALIARLMEKDAGNRFQSSAEVAELLEGFLAHLLQPATVAPPALPGYVVAVQSARWRRLWCGGLAVLAIGLSIGFVLLTQVIPSPVRHEAPSEFYHDFRGRPLPGGLAFFDATEFIHEEAEGLRITIPKNRKEAGGASVATTFPLRGDFEITTTFEILNAETPPPSYGVGVALLIKAMEPSPKSAAVCRLARSNGRQVASWDQSFDELDSKGKPRTDGGASVCFEKVGRLRLRRVKSVLFFSWAPGTNGGDFTQIHQSEFGTEDIRRAIVTGVTGRKPCDLDMRILDLRIQTSRAAEDPATAVEPPPSFWRIWPALGVLSALLLAAGLALYCGWRRRRIPASVAAAVPRAGAKEETPLLSIVCSGCGKKLKLRKELAGKQVKCPGCSLAVRAPG